MPLISHYIRPTLAAALLVLFALGPRSIAAQEPPDLFKFEARVKVIVSADGPLQGIVRSYVSQRLRSLDGVVVTDDDPGYELSVSVMETYTKAGTRIGYAMSSVGVSLWKESTVESMKTPLGFTEDQMVWIRSFGGTGTVVHHLLQTGPEDDLEDLCRRVVASFDTNALENSRKMIQRLRDMLNKARKKPGP